MIKVAIINPPRVNGHPVCREDRLEYVDYGEVFPPLTLLYAASILEQEGYEVLMVDANGWDLKIEEVKKKLKKFKPDVLLTRFAIDTIIQDNQVLKIAKKVNPRCLTLVRSKIIADSSLLQKEVLANYPIDFLIAGDLEVVVPDIIQALTRKQEVALVKGLLYLKNKKIIYTGKPSGIKDIDQLPYPAYHLSGGINCYQTSTQRPPFTTVFSSRGCPYSCKFCSGHDTYLARKPQKVVDEIEWLIEKYHLKNFYFFDDIFTLNQKRAETICREIIKRKLKVRWSCGTRVDCVSLELLKLMKQAGCWLISYGLESGNQAILDRNNKGFTIEQAERAVKETQKAGIFAYAMLVLGLPGESKQTIEKTVCFVHKINPDYAQYCVAVPFPNTPFFDQYRKMKWITTFDWRKFNPLGFPVISNPCLSDVRLHQLRHLAYRKFLLRPGFLLRKLSLSNWKWNIEGGKFLAGHLLTTLRREMIR